MIVAEVLVEEIIVKGKPTEVIYTLFFNIENDYYQVVLRYYSNCNYLLKIGKTRKEIFKNLLINGKLECSEGRVFHLNFNRSNFMKCCCARKDWWLEKIVSLFELEREDIEESIDSFPKIKHSQSIEFQGLIEKLKITISH